MPVTELESHHPASAGPGATPARRRWIWYLSTLFICVHFGLSYVAHERFFPDLRLYTDGKLDVPFQYRTLVAWIFRGLISSPLFLAIARHAPSFYRDPYLLAYLVITIAALAGAVFATSGTIRKLTGDEAFSHWSALLVIYMTYFNLMLVYGLTNTYPYDVPSLFFFCMGVNFVVREKKLLYYLIFVPAVFNRETICFLTVFFAVWEWFRIKGDIRSKAVRILPHVAMQAAIWVAIKIYLFKLYAHNHPGGVVPNRLFGNLLGYNLRELATPGQWPLLVSISGFTVPLLIALRSWIGNRALAWACAIVLPLWFCGMMCVGVIVEIRVFTEVSAILAPALALIIFHRYYQVPSGRLDAIRGEAPIPDS